MLVFVKVREDYRWSTARVGGREFTKQRELMSEAVLNDEMYNSPLLVIDLAEMTGQEVDATDSARDLAQEAGVDLWSVVGSGKDGRVLKRDVQEALDADS